MIPLFTGDCCSYQEQNICAAIEQYLLTLCLIINKPFEIETLQRAQTMKPLCLINNNNQDSATCIYLQGPTIAGMLSYTFK